LIRSLVIVISDPKTELLKIIKQVNDLPSLPTVATNALSLMGNPRTSMKDLGNVIGSDQAITSKLLKMVNSAYYGFPRRISTISQALVVLGVEGLRSLIMGLSVQSMFNTNLSKLLWIHSVSSAATAKLITQKYGSVHPEESFVVALIHDIGRLILCQHFPDEFSDMGFLYMDSIQDLSKEREFFGMDHCEVGAIMATNWNLPDKIIESIKYHHKPNVVMQNQVVLIVCISEGIAYYINELDRSDRTKKVNLYDFVNPEYLQRLKIRELPDQMIVDIKSKTKDLIEIFASN